MGKRMGGISARIFVALALMLGGLAPVSAQAAMAGASGAGAMAMMPGMAMPHVMSGKDRPAKPRPCCGEDGCCVAGSCAVSLPPLAIAWAASVRPASEILFDHAMGAGITFPPSLRPPISRA